MPKLLRACLSRCHSTIFRQVEAADQLGGVTLDIDQSGLGLDLVIRSGSIADQQHHRQRRKLPRPDCCWRAIAPKPD